jgi:hypothetical protein
MNRLWLLAMVMFAAAVAGCDGASSAREMGRPRIAVASDGARSGATQEATVQASGQAGDEVRRSPGIVEASFDDVKFPMEKSEPFVESMLTDGVRELFDQRIRIRGYMYPTPRKRGLKQFVLVRDNMECCFGPGAALFDCILVTMTGGATAEYSIRPIAVEGTFRFEPVAGPDGRPLAIYQMAGEAVE